MALTTYTELQASVADWLNRADLTAQITGDFIPAFEAKARRQLEDWLRVDNTATNVTADYTLANSDQVKGVALMDGAGGVRNAPLVFLSMESYHRHMAQSSTVVSPPFGVFVDRDESANQTVLRFYPPVSVASPIANLHIQYVKTLTALSGGNPTNELLAQAPDLYLKGTLAEAADFLQWIDKKADWSAERDAGFQKLISEAVRRSSPGVPGRRTLPRVFG